MNKAKKIEFINELNSLINIYVDEYHLFCGGCCFAAALIAYCFELVGIKYKTAIFQYMDVLNIRGFTKVINGNGIAHVAIEVEINRTKMFIGKCDGIYRYFQNSGEDYKIRHYRHVTARMILDGYEHNCWNNKHKKKHNEDLVNDVNKILSKYGII